MITQTTSSSRHRRPLMLLLAVAVLTIATWALVTSGAGREPAGTTQPTAATAAAASTSASTPAAAPTEMPDGTAIPAPSPAAAAEPGTGATEDVGRVRVKPPVALDEPGDFDTGVTVALADIEAVQGVARARGEIDGPALKVTVEVRNGSGDPVSLDGLVVALSSGPDRTPASAFVDGSSPMVGELAAGSSATGDYVFAVPEDERDDVRVEISYTGTAPTVAFAGSLP